MIGRQRKQQTELLTECQGCNVVQYVYLHARKTQNATDDRRQTRDERGERRERRGRDFFARTRIYENGIFITPLVHTQATSNKQQATSKKQPRNKQQE